MKTKNMKKLCENVIKIKQAIIEHHSIVDDEYLLRDLIKDKTDITDTKEIEKMTDTILYLIENNSHFTKEIENQIVKDVKKMLYYNTEDVLLSFNDMISLLYNNSVLINDDDKEHYQRDMVENFIKEKNNKKHSYITIPCTSNLQKHLFIEFELLKFEPLELDYDYIDIDITDIYID